MAREAWSCRAGAAAHAHHEDLVALLVQQVTGTLEPEAAAGLRRVVDVHDVLDQLQLALGGHERLLQRELLALALPERAHVAAMAATSAAHITTTSKMLAFTIAVRCRTKKDRAVACVVDGKCPNENTPLAAIHRGESRTNRSICTHLFHQCAEIRNTT